MWITQNVSRETTHIGRHISTKSKYILRKKIAKYRRKQIKKKQIKSECVFIYGVEKAGDKKDKEREKRCFGELAEKFEAGERGSRELALYRRNACGVAVDSCRAVNAVIGAGGRGREARVQS